MLRKFAAGACAVLVGSLGAGTASAGELTGNGKVTGARTNASSICAYSLLSGQRHVSPGGPARTGRTTATAAPEVAASPA
jgi:hypothetical protein